MKGPVFVYGLTDGPASQVRYVGKSHRPSRRLREHVWSVSAGEPGHKANWIRSVLASGGTIHLVILAEAASDAEAFAIERMLIHAYRTAGVRLTNQSDGGEGPSGVQRSDEYLKKLSLSLRGNQNAKGRVVSEATREKIGAARRGAKFSDEHRAKLSAAKLGRKTGPCSIERRRRISESNKGRVITPEHLAKLVAGRIATPVSDETRKKLAAAARRQWSEWRGHRRAEQAASQP